MLSSTVSSNHYLAAVCAHQTGVNNANSAEVFKVLFEKDRRRLYAYIFAFVSDRAIADDVFQETSLTLWKEFDKFELGTNFSKWANVIAFNRIRRMRQEKGKYQLGLSEDFLTEFNNNMAQFDTDMVTKEKRWQQLEQCCALLSSPLKSIYQGFYVQNLTAQNIADNTGRSIHAIRKSVHKLRKRLFDCVDKHTSGIDQ
ncbi:sigma-70 family RNA polymerase sigma factor [Alteromonas sp. KUL49]|uniref:sigma-70 family RNA polymerase sigma factor n=1 Tax=Alteromonas sp. KUL49 TaxID=2480798 RepID=UPI00102EF0DE|nr:sigma-70 family RNA polymerase sigma factor [Alteromonas sp. KUL49]TAP37318.1 sigma-70 family RNA polymerase sigma factor [Alteromonas sp. KUL49]GEA12941.1 DNA-directed RNA polymerase sigma-70 factor [Alteromonas sp. KUL49]